jgi:hypothetical protein
MISEEKRSEIQKLAQDFISQSRSVLAKLVEINTSMTDFKIDNSLLSYFLNFRRAVKNVDSDGDSLVKANMAFTDLRGRQIDAGQMLLSAIQRENVCEEDELHKFAEIVEQFITDEGVAYNEALKGRLHTHRKSEPDLYWKANESLEPVKIWLIHYDLF